MCSVILVYLPGLFSNERPKWLLMLGSNELTYKSVDNPKTKFVYKKAVLITKYEDVPYHCIAILLSLTENVDIDS